MANAGDYLLTKDEADLGDDEKEAYKAAKERLDGSDVEGSLFVKAEWEGFGEAMPPARSETLFQLSSLKKNRFEADREEAAELMNEKKSIDVNDPRNEAVLRNLQNARNDCL